MAIVRDVMTEARPPETIVAARSADGFESVVDVGDPHSAGGILAESNQVPGGIDALERLLPYRPPENPVARGDPEIALPVFIRVEAAALREAHAFAIAVPAPISEPIDAACITRPDRAAAVLED